MHAKSLAMASTIALAAFTLVACAPKQDKPADSATTAAAPAPAAETPASAAAPAPTGNENMPMQKIDLAPGNGAEIKSGQNALVHYTGWLFDAAAPENKGKKFDSSVDANEPFEFPVGAGHGHQGLGRGRGRHEGRRQAPTRHSARHGLRRARRRWRRFRQAPRWCSTSSWWRSADEAAVRVRGARHRRAERARRRPPHPCRPADRRHLRHRAGPTRRSSSMAERSPPSRAVSARRPRAIG